MLRKKERSSWGLVSTEREGGSHLCAVKGTEVSTVSGSVELEIRRWKVGVQDDAVARGFRRLDLDEEVRRDKAISTVGLDR